VKWLRRFLGLAAVLATVAGGVWYLARPRPVAVVARTVTHGAVEWTVANTRAGTVNANRRAKLAPGQGGQVDVLSVREGDRVRAGQVLLQLWNADLKAQLALARSEVERAAAQAEEARLRAELAEREAERQRELLQREISALERVDRAESEAKAARASQRAAAAEAEVRQKQVEVVGAQLERTIVRAPFDGVVAEINGEVGEFVTPSPVGIPTPPAVDLIDDGVPYVTAPIDEVDAAHVRNGMTARITLDAFGKRAFAGRVRRIAPYVTDREKQARTVDVEVELTEPPADAVLLPGYSADVEILLAEVHDVVRVPTEALRGAGRVLVLLADGTLAEREVETGLANWRFTEIRRGLQPGEVIVTSLDRAGVAAGALAVAENDPAAEASDQ
jgi:HlyD family secretion protein